MNIEPLRRLVLETPGTIGQTISRRIALERAAAGDMDAAGALTTLLGPETVAALIEAGAPPAMLRSAIRTVVLYSHKSLPGLVRMAGGRLQFAAWCRRAEFELPTYVGDGTVTIARGTINCTPEQNAAGMHWGIGCPGSDPFDGAAFFASGWPHPTVVIARVPRTSLVYFVDGVLPYEVLPEDVPAEYEVVTDHEPIVRGAVRFAYHRKNLRCGVPFDPSTSEFDRSVAQLIDWWETHQGSDDVVSIAA